MVKILMIKIYKKNLAYAKFFLFFLCNQKDVGYIRKM